MDIDNLPEKRKLLKTFMALNPNGSETDLLLKATGFTKEELIFSNDIVKKFPNTFWGYDYYVCENNKWYNTNSGLHEIDKLKSEIESLLMENKLLKKE